MPSTKRLVRQERKANYLYFRDLCKEKKYDEATIVLFANPEIMNYLSKKEIITIMNAYREDYMKSIVNLSEVSALEKAAKNVGVQLNGGW